MVLQYYLPGADKKSNDILANGSPEDAIDDHHAIGSSTLAIVGDSIHVSNAS
jgi:hypothetical protein